jgi:hypothetical protein
MLNRCTNHAINNIIYYKSNDCIPGAAINNTNKIVDNHYCNINTTTTHKCNN